MAVDYQVEGGMMWLVAVVTTTLSLLTLPGARGGGAVGGAVGGALGGSLPAPNIDNSKYFIANNME